MERLRILREKRNITQLRLAMALEISQETISSYELGKTEPPFEVLVKLADFLNTSIDYLLERIDNDAPIEENLQKIIDEQLNDLISTYMRLNDNKKKDLVWFSKAIENKDN